MCVDTYHLFPETMVFLDEIEKHYGFKAEIFAAEGCEDKAAYDKKFGADLWIEDVEQYDKVCLRLPCATDPLPDTHTHPLSYTHALSHARLSQTH